MLSFDLVMRDLIAPHLWGFFRPGAVDGEDWPPRPVIILSTHVPDHKWFRTWVHELGHLLWGPHAEEAAYEHEAEVVAQYYRVACGYVRRRMCN